MNLKIVLTGVTGQVGSALKPLLAPIGDVLAPVRNELDITNLAELEDFLLHSRPDWIVNPAAYTAVDRAENESSLAYAINRDAVKVIAETAAKINAGVIHFSTDYVYAGNSETPWTETDAPSPLGVYGASKLAGDKILESSGAAHLIFRTSWVYGSTGKNFLRTILNLARQKEELNVVADQHGSPTWSTDLARLTIHAIRMAEKRYPRKPREGLDGIQGVYHACNEGFTTWFGFASEFLRLASEEEPKTHFAKLNPISSAQYPTLAQRPSNSRLDCSKLHTQFGFSMPSWQQATAAVMREINASLNVSPTRP